MGGKLGLKLYFVLILAISPMWGSDGFRTFTTASGQPFTGKVISYEGQIFYIQGKDGKL